MIGQIVAEEHFLHHGMHHQLFVVRSEQEENEYRFEVRRTAPGADHPESVYEKTVAFSPDMLVEPDNSIGPLIDAEIDKIRREVTAEEDIHAHDP